jgi:hypothetical protein
MMFELLFYAMDRFMNVRNTDAERTITLLPGKVSEERFAESKTMILPFSIGRPPQLPMS